VIPFTIQSVVSFPPPPLIDFFFLHEPVDRCAEPSAELERIIANDEEVPWTCPIDSETYLTKLIVLLTIRRFALGTAKEADCVICPSLVYFCNTPCRSCCHGKLRNEKGSDQGRGCLKMMHDDANAPPAVTKYLIAAA
jgi:hypothetical protein